MAKNIVLLSDGTGNSAAKLFKTNVRRIHGALDLSDPSRQIAYYDNGVGTSSFPPLAILGGAFGFGLKRNVLDLYRFACRNYRENDRIFGFGFSRGAFTIRIVAGLITRVGLVPYTGNEAQLSRDALSAYRVYRSRFNVSAGLVKPLRRLRDGIVSLWRRARGLPTFDPERQVAVEAIHFMGVWDTVAAYGGPIEEVTRGIDSWIWPLSMPDRFMSAKIKRACHALALDDERNAFWPVLWDEGSVSGPKGLQPMTERWAPPDKPSLPEIDRQRVSQVWFAGMHSDVGGGYAQDGLSYVTLEWMMDRALAYDLILKPAERDRLRELADPFDELNDSRRGLGGYYRYKPRKLSDVYALDPVKATITRDMGRMVRTAVRTAKKRRHAAGQAPPAAASPPSPIIHESVFRRLVGGLDGYSPLVLPEVYRVTTKAGAVEDGLYEHPSQAAARARRQERTWNWVWLRRVVYFATVFASLFVAALPLIVKRWPGPGQESVAAFLLPLIDLLGAFSPGFAAPWIGAFRESPGLFAVGAAIVAGLLAWGGTLQRRIGDVMLDVWHPAVDGPPRRVGPWAAPRDWLYRVRTSGLYRGFFYWLTRWILPTAFALVVVCAVPVGLSRVLFAVGDSIGLICGSADRTDRFDTASLCHPTGVQVRPGRTYTVTLTPTDRWRDGDRDSSRPGINGEPEGLGWSETTWKMVPGLPLRRHLTEDWFAVVARIGVTGGDEQVLRFTESEPIGPGEWNRRYRATFTAGSAGEVFTFVNDSVLGVPWLAGVFYANNKGHAEVTITEARAGRRGAGGPGRP